MRALKKILIAEDELLIAKVLKMILEKNRYEVKHVIDEEAAVKMAIEFIPDVIILDVYLKNKSSGIEAGKKIRKLGIKSPIVFTTGNSFEETADEIKKIENCHLLIKPIETEGLIRFLESKFES